jgi:uncharacterized membrane protein YvbJ
MALTSCPECGKKVSEKAPRCPHCGYPIATGEQAPTATATGKHQPESRGWFRKVFGGWWTIILCILTLAIAIAPFIKLYSEYVKTNQQVEEIKKQRRGGGK